MQFSSIELDLGRVDSEDDAFRISTALDFSALSQSIKEAGLINPPVVQPKTGDVYRIVSGFLRLDACMSLGMSKLPVRAVDASVSDLECAVIAVTENASQRELNVLEQSRAFSMLGPDIPWNERVPLIKRALLLADSPNQRYVEQVESLCRMPDLIQKGVVDGAIALPTAVILNGMDKEQAMALAEVFCDMGLSLGKQRETLTLVKEIAAREDLSIIDVLECPDVLTILNDDNMDRNAKARLLRTYLKRRRFPSIMLAQETYEAEVKGLGLPKGVRLEAPPHFEGVVYSLKLDFHRIEDLSKKQDVIKDIIKMPGLGKILAR